MWTLILGYLIVGALWGALICYITSLIYEESLQSMRHEIRKEVIRVIVYAYILWPIYVFAIISEAVGREHSNRLGRRMKQESYLSAQ